MTAAMKLKDAWLFERKAMTNLGNILKSRDITFPTKVHSQSYDSSNSHERMWKLDHTRLSTEKLMLLNCGAREDFWESLGQQRMRWVYPSLTSIASSMGMSLSKLWEIVKDREAWSATVHRVTEGPTQISNWTTTKCWISGLMIDPSSRAWGTQAKQWQKR